MGYSTPPIKAGPDIISGADINTYLRDNLLFFKAHIEATAGVHGLAAGIHVLGVIDEDYHIEAQRSAEYGPGQGDYSVTFTWLDPFAELISVTHITEETGGPGDALDGKPDVITAMSVTGCTIYRTISGGDNPRFRLHVIALGRD